MIGLMVRRKKCGTLGILVKDVRRGVEKGSFFFLSKVPRPDLWDIRTRGNGEIQRNLWHYLDVSGWYFGSPNDKHMFQLVAMENE